jgi:putative hydrolase of the HAD superfamily
MRLKPYLMLRSAPAQPGRVSKHAGRSCSRPMSELPRAMLIDLDDTILSAFGAAEGQWRRVIAEFGDRLGPHPPEAVYASIQAYSRHLWSDQARHKHWRHRIGDARRHIIETAFAQLRAENGLPAPPPAVCHALADRFNEIQEAELKMFPGAHETLDRLKELGVRLALVTNGAAEPQRKKVIRFALEHRFDHIQIEGEHGFGKPEEQAYLHAMSALGVEARDTWMIGDNLEWEVVAPQRLGIFAIWYDGYGQGLPPDSPIRPDRIIRSLAELLPS